MLAIRPASPPLTELAELADLSEQSSANTGSASTGSDDIRPDEPRQAQSVQFLLDLHRQLTATPVSNSESPVQSIRAGELVAALDRIARTPLPSAREVFPWLHGLHALNSTQRAFLGESSPPTFFKNITLVKVGSQHSCRLRGTVSHRDFLGPDDVFLDLDPVCGVGLRNFHIQTAKIATLSDIVVYSKTGNPEPQLALARRIATAQARHRDANPGWPLLHTYIVEDPFSEFEMHFPHVVAITSAGTYLTRDFLFHERREMTEMSAATEVTHNFYLGTAADSGEDYDLHIECINQATIPLEHSDQSRLEFPSSGSLALGNLTDADLDAFVDFVAFLHRRTHADSCRVLLFCLDGYTETSLLALAYLMYASGLTISEAYVSLHKQHGRAFFTFPSDQILLTHLQTRILSRSPSAPAQPQPLPPWFMLMDGSLPSKIFPHLYLGNLGHANNPGLLKELGISRVLSVGEPINWESPDFTLMYIDKIQDDGIDSLSKLIDHCLSFIDDGYNVNESTLVHCRVGVSRSATVCIAETIKRKSMPLHAAYLYVRARRLNVIIQPNLRFMYELMKWDEERGGVRQMEWHELCREIANMNKAYINA